MDKITKCTGAMNVKPYYNYIIFCSRSGDSVL